MKPLRIFLLLLSAILFLSACSLTDTPPAQGDDLTQEESAAPIRERVPAVYYGDALYFTSDPLVPDQASQLQSVGKIASTVADNALPEQALQSNCGYVGCEVYTLSSAPDMLYILDGDIYHGFMRPEPHPAAPIKSAIRYNGILYTCSNMRSELIDASKLQEIGSVLSSVEENTYPTEDFYSNCGHVGSTVYTGNGSSIYVATDDGYLAFSIADDGTPPPIIRYENTLYCENFSATLTEAPADLECVGFVHGTIGRTRIPEKNFYANCGLVGCSIYKSDAAPSTLYIYFEGKYIAFD